MASKSSFYSGSAVTPTQADAIEASVSNAATSATAASTSKTNAANSATASEVSKDASVVAKDASVAAKNSSETAASNSSSSASTATTRANTATAQADIATAKATIATDKAAVATTKASEAANSASSMSSSVTAATAAKDAALAALDSFDDRYLGPKSSNPSVDNDGNSLVAGTLYFNSTDDVMKVYEGSTWVAAFASISGALLKSGGAMTGAITTNSTFDGRDVATDGTKLDGIEASATADQTKADIQGLGIDVPATNLTGTIAAARLSTATTQAESDDSTKIATTAYVVDKITTLIGGAPSTLNDLNELAAAINDDASYNSTLTTALATKLPLSGGTMTGNISHGGNFTLDVAGDIILDADGAEVFFADGGTNYGKTMKSGNDFRLKSEISDGDFVVQGVDNGSVITALTLDMSDAGTAIFNNKVGIGTTSPTRQMSVENTLANGGGSIGITSSDSSTSGSLGIVHFGNSTDSSLASIGGLADGSTSAGALLFKTEAAGGAIEERMRIDSSGNVGIGIDHTPAQLLHVQAGSSGNGAIRVGGGAGLEISHNNSGATIQRIDSLYRTTNNSANLQLRTGTLTFHTGTSSTERMRVSSSGIVTAPYQPAFQGQAEALNNIPANSVNQTILFSEIFDQGGNFASNTFTAPVTGKYQINVHVLLENIDSAANYYQLQLITSNRIYYETVDADYGQDNSYLAVQIAVLADLDVSDTAVVRIHQNGGTAQTDVNTTTSKFSGFLAC